MIQPTEEMHEAFRKAEWGNNWSGGDRLWEEGLTAVLAVVERDYYVSLRPTPEQIAGLPKPPRRLRGCVERWPQCQTGELDPRCCRFPKSCSATVYDEDRIADADLEPERAP